jgi:hypothetical protein
MLPVCDHRDRPTPDQSRIDEKAENSDVLRFLAVSSGFGDQVCVVPACRVDEGVIVSLAA